MPDLTVSANIDTLLGSASFSAARTALGLGAGDSPTFAGLTISGVITAQNGMNTANDINMPLGKRFGFGGDVYLMNLLGNTGALEQVNGSTAQTFRVYNTYTDASNYERAVFGFTSNVLRIGTENAGTGSARAIDFVVGGSAAGRMSRSGDDGSLILGNPIFLQFSLTGSSGSGILASAGNIYIQPLGSVVLAPSASIIKIMGETNAFPALKRSGTSLQARLADDSAFTNIQGKITTDNAYTAGAITDTGYLTIYDSTGTAYKVAVCL